MADVVLLVYQVLYTSYSTYTAGATTAPPVALLTVMRYALIGVVYVRRVV